MRPGEGRDADAIGEAGEHLLFLPGIEAGRAAKEATLGFRARKTGLGALDQEVAFELRA